MKKIMLVASVFTALLFSSCSYRRGIGAVNNELLLRDWYGNACIELSIESDIRSNFREITYDYSPYYRYDSDYAAYETTLTLGLALYGTLYRNDFLRISAGIKYKDMIYARFSEEGRRYFMDGHDYFRHTISGYSRYASDQAVSIVFPDIEISTPFMDDLKFIIKADLLSLSLRFRDAVFSFNFREENNTYDGEYVSFGSVDFSFPDSLESIYFSSTYVDLGNLKLGLVYYFK